MSQYIPRADIIKPKRLIWAVELRKIIDANKSKHALKNKVISTRTKQFREKALHQSFKELRNDCNPKCKLDDPRNFREKHFKLLLKLWLSQELSPSTIQNKTSLFRVFCTWIGRPNMIKPLDLYVEDKALVKRVQVATTDKSWTGNNLSYEDKLKEIDAYDSRAGAQLRIIKAFGLRREEAVCFQPRRAIKLGSPLNSIFVDRGTKNGLARYIPIENDEQRDALSHACNIAKNLDSHIGWEDKTLEKSIKRMANIMQKFKITKKDAGTTLHGLRHEAMHNIYENITGHPCPVKGGKKEDIDPDLDLKARLLMTRAAGHARLGITNAYAGSFKKSPPSEEKNNLGA